MTVASIWTVAFWKATAERAVSTAAESALLVLAADQVNVVTVDWPTVAGFAAGGAVLSVIKALAVGFKDGNPSATNAEIAVDPPRHRAEQGPTS